MEFFSSLLVPLYLIATVAVLPWGSALSGGNTLRFFMHDILPALLRESGADAPGWTLGLAHMKLFDRALPGVVTTIQRTMIALVVTGATSILFFPPVSPLLLGPWRRSAGHVFLVILGSTPEYILAFLLLPLWGPSMLPAIVALSLHNGAITGHLVERFTESVKLRRDAAKGIDLYAYEALPLDGAFFLVLITALMNIGVDMISRCVRARLRLKTSPEWHRP